AGYRSIGNKCPVRRARYDNDGSIFSITAGDDIDRCRSCEKRSIGIRLNNASANRSLIEFLRIGENTPALKISSCIIYCCPEALIFTAEVRATLNQYAVKCKKKMSFPA